jgi:hypothetical protein
MSRGETAFDLTRRRGDAVLDISRGGAAVDISRGGTAAQCWISHAAQEPR